MYKVDIFTDKLEYASFAMIDGNQNIELDYLAFDAYTIETRLIECKKGYFVHITEDNEFVCDGIVSDVKPDKATQQISIKPLQTMFDEEVFYSPVTDAITWLATNINNTYLNNADTYQNRPINLTYTTYSESFPLTGFNLHETINILSVMISALKTHGVVVDCSLDLPNKHIKVDIHKSDTDPFHIRADLDNVIESSVTLGDSYGSKNKAEIQKTKTVDDETTYHGITNFYLHNDGSIDSTDSNRVWPVFRSIENLQQDDDMTDQDWLDAALARAKEILEPQKYDNEIMLTYSKYDKLIHPNDIPIGREVIIYLKGNTYASVLTGKRIKGNEITLIFGVVRTEFTKKLSIEEREKLTFQNTVSAVIAEADERYTSQNKTKTLGSDGTYYGEHIELNRTEPYGSHGGFIDFHSGGSSSDYTSRIIEDRNGHILITAPNGFDVNGKEVRGRPWHWTTGTNGTNGYVGVLRFVVKETYANSPIQVVIAQRNLQSVARINIQWASVNGLDPSIAYFTYQATSTQNRYFLLKTTTSTWELYVQKTEAYDYIDIIDVIVGTYMHNKLTITAISTMRTSAPTWTNTATKTTD